MSRLLVRESCALALLAACSDVERSADSDVASDTTATSCCRGSGSGEGAAVDSGDTTDTGPTGGDTDTGDTAGVPAVAELVSYVGGSDYEQVRDVAWMPDGSLVIVGGTDSDDFPIEDAWQATRAGSVDVFVMRWAADGTLLFSTYLGGPNYDRAYAVEVDDDGDIYVAGRAGDGFPTTTGVLQEAFGGDVNPSATYGAQDGFACKLSGDGELLWATYAGGDDQEIVRDLDVDAAHDVFLAVGGTTRDWPHLSKDAFQPKKNSTKDAVVVSLSPDGTTLRYGSYIGGGDDDGGTPSVRALPDGTAYYLAHTNSDDLAVTASAFQKTAGGTLDLMLLRVSPDGSTLEWLSYLGGAGNDFTETHGLAVTSLGEPVVAVTTTSADLFTNADALQPDYAGTGGSSTGGGTNYGGDGYVAVIAPDGTAIRRATYLGGSVGEGLEGVSVDASDRIYVSGATFSSDFPVTVGARQGTIAGDSDFLVARLAADLGVLEHASFLGGSGEDNGRSSDVDPSGHLAVVGEAFSDDFPTMGAASQPTFQGGDRDGGWAILPETAP